MCRTITNSVTFLIAGSLLWIAPANAQQAPPEPPAGPAAAGFSEDYDELARGPIHEALAQPYVADPEPGLIVTEEPPQPIDELPPDLVPSGHNIEWISGYWAWDDVESRFLWVSGFWRDVPPDQQWVPGTWVEVEEGFQWIPGFWTLAEQTEVQYLPYPPETQERGPTYEAPSEEYFWVPGSWLWQQDDYAWQPGYWTQGSPNWVWVPHRYVWTPHGVVFVAGYWDYPLSNRGLLFAPVHFHRPVWRDAGFRYTPRIVMNWGSLMVHLFVRPTYNHYYVGDYYDDRFVNFGFQPWHSYGVRGRGYDPLLTYYGWSSRRRGVDFVSRMQGWHNYYRRNDDFRPPHRHRDFDDYAARGRRRQIDQSVLNNASISQSLEVAARDEGRGRFRRVQPDQRENIQQAAREIREVQQRRRESAVRSPRETPTEGRGALALPGGRRRGLQFDDDERPGEQRRPSADGRRPQVPQRPDAPRARGPADERESIERGERPDVRRPATRRPETPDIRRPGVRRPETPDTRRPETRRPETPDARRPETRRPETPDARRPGTRRPETPDVRRPEARPPQRRETLRPLLPDSRRPGTSSTRRPETRRPETPLIQRPEARRPEARLPQGRETRRPATSETRRPETRRPETPQTRRPAAQRPPQQRRETPAARETRRPETPAAQRPQTQRRETPAARGPATRETRRPETPAARRPEPSGRQEAGPSRERGNPPARDIKDDKKDKKSRG